MQPGFQLFPDSASTFAPRTDALLAYLTGVSLFFALIIFIGLIWFALRYRRRSPDEVGADIEGNMTLEITWMVIPFILTIVMFVWGAGLFMEERTPPARAQEIYVVGKQWMWKVQHPEGRKEINELHVPVGRPVKLVMASEDVIHDFFVPAFRVKEDVVPGKYTTLWFEATKTGKYHLFCSQYCGTNHALMRGWVYVLEPADYEAWLAGTNPGEGTVSLAESGQKLFTQLACQTCHQQEGRGRGPSLVGVYGSTVKLSTGQTVVADDAYIRESILQPNAKIVEGYQPLMPTFQGVVTEDQLIQLMAYVKSLALPATRNAAGTTVPGEPQAAAPSKVKGK